jgi:hypothetical protein
MAAFGRAREMPGSSSATKAYSSRVEILVVIVPGLIIENTMNLSEMTIVLNESLRATL